MRKVVVFIASSLDGFIAGPDGDIGWLFHDQDYGYKKFLASVDTLIMGYNTYKVSKSFGEWPYDGKECYVFSRKIRKASKNISFTNNPIAFTRRLKQKDGKNIWLVGGSQTIGLLIKEKLVDEIILSVHPIILGKGIPVFGETRHNLRLINTKRFNSGLVQMTYEVQS